MRMGASLLGLIVFLFIVSFSSALDITACSNLSYSNLVYNVKNNITQSGDACLHIYSDNITINCSGYNVNSGTGYAIRLGTSGECHSNITIHDCNMSGYGGLAISNGYTYGGGCTCGYTTGDLFNNNAINATTQGLSYSCVSGMNATNNTIVLGSTVSGIGIYEAFSSSQYYDNMTIVSPSGISFKTKYSYGHTILNHSSLTAIGGTAIYNEVLASEIIDYSIMNASQISHTFNGGGPMIRHSTGYVSSSGFSASWADIAEIYDSQIIANGSATAISCDWISLWPYYDLIIQRSNITSIDNVAIKNGNAVWGIGCGITMNDSYVFSNNSHALMEYDKGKYYDSRFETNGTDKSAVISSPVVYETEFFNDTLQSNGGGYALQELSDNKASYENITLNGSTYLGVSIPVKISISNTSRDMNITSSNVSFNFTADNRKYVNVSADGDFYLHLRIYYSNITYNISNESLWVLAGFDGYNFTNMSDSYTNISGQYVEGTAMICRVILTPPFYECDSSGLFAVIANGTFANFTHPAGDCYYWHNCTINSTCTSNLDCASGVCFEGHCIDSGGCVGEGCSIIPNIVEMIGILLGSVGMVRFLLALAILGTGAYLGFRYGGPTGAVVLVIGFMFIMTLIPSPADPLVPFWMALMALLSGAVGLVYTYGKQTQG